VPMIGFPRPYAEGVQLDPNAEFERVREKYAPIRRPELVLYVLAVVLLAIVSLVRQVDWFLFAAVFVSAGAWELTKFRLRSNARRFADSGR